MALNRDRGGGSAWVGNGRAALLPTRYARIGGALYLLIIIAGIAGPLLTRDPLIMPGDAAATVRVASGGRVPFGGRPLGARLGVLLASPLRCVRSRALKAVAMKIANQETDR